MDFFIWRATLELRRITLGMGDQGKEAGVILSVFCIGSIALLYIVRLGRFGRMDKVVDSM